MNTVARARDLPRVTRQRVTFKDAKDYIWPVANFI